MKKFLFLIAALLAAWFYATPYFTLRSIHSAIEAQDVRALSQYVDFPALKESIKANLRVKMTEAIAQTHNNNPYGNVLGAAASQLALQMVDPVLDAALTPESIAALLQGKNSNASGSDKRDNPLGFIASGKKSERSTGYQNFDTFTLTHKDKASGEELISFILKRQGLFSWKVAGVNFPK
ncbi:membrane protein [Betaproteobacteria bacterium]|nr:membrane protein [Betaproteobacteria bacterium]